MPLFLMRYFPNRLPPAFRRSVPIVSQVLAVWVACLIGSAANAQDFAKDLRPLLVTYCIECHKDGRAKGDLNLDRFRDMSSARGKADVWKMVIDRVKAGEMPPEKSRQLSAEERDRLLRTAQAMMKEELDCNEIASDANVGFYKGHVMSRRLNRLEYGNTVRDLIGVQTSAAAGLPEDGAGGEGFDNNGDALFTSAIHVEKYLDAAEKALAPVFAKPTPASPFTAEQIATARKTVLTETPNANRSPRDAARKTVETFARRAFRRPVQAAEVDRYLTLFDKATARGDAYDPAIRLALQAVLISPNFLFLVEPEPEQDGVAELGDLPLASRLSYFLWASMPDDELFHLAVEGKLRNDDVLRQQVRRMLKDPKVRGMADSFATQWLGLRPLNDTAKPDASKFPEFNDEIADAMRQEAVLLFEHVVRQDRPLTELISADYTFLNEPLAKLYGIPGVSGREMRQVKLPDRNRGGIIGLGAVHVTTSYSLRTSPVLRGKWVLGDVLGARVPPAPPNAGELPADGKSEKGLSLREQLEIHRTKPECASCHQRMDPLGFGMENFDAIGRWRTRDGDQTLDTSGKLPGGETFSGPAELKQVLLKKRRDFEQNLVRKLLGFSLGRELRAGGRGAGQFDQCVIDDSMKALQTEDRATVVFETIVLSKPFRYRFIKK